MPIPFLNPWFSEVYVLLAGLAMSCRSLSSSFSLCCSFSRASLCFCCCNFKARFWKKKKTPAVTQFYPTVSTWSLVSDVSRYLQLGCLVMQHDHLLPNGHQFIVINLRFCELKHISGGYSCDIKPALLNWTERQFELTSKFKSCMVLHSLNLVTSWSRVSNKISWFCLWLVETDNQWFSSAVIWSQRLGLYTEKEHVFTTNTLFSGLCRTSHKMYNEEKKTHICRSAELVAPVPSSGSCENIYGIINVKC